MGLSVIKRCGYANGYCVSEEVCRDYGKDYWNAAERRELAKVARGCRYFQSKADALLVEVHKARRRRDWKVGNPYQEERERK